jgi:hypothetical protein
MRNEDSVMSDVSGEYLQKYNRKRERERERGREREREEKSDTDFLSFFSSSFLFL